MCFLLWTVRNRLQRILINQFSYTMKYCLLLFLMFCFLNSKAQLNTDSVITELRNKIRYNEFFAVKVCPKHKYDCIKTKVIYFTADGIKIRKKITIYKSGIKIERVKYRSSSEKISVFIAGEIIEKFRWDKKDDTIIFVRNNFIKRLSK